MDFEFVPMNLEYIKTIKTWKYSGFVKSIYVEPYFTSYDEKTGKMKGPNGCEGYAVLSRKKLIGLYEYYFNDEIVEIGLALSPDVVGKGYGEEFVRKGIEFLISNFDYKRDYLKLSVNTNNKPAVSVYKKVGFKIYKEEGDSILMKKLIK